MYVARRMFVAKRRFVAKSGEVLDGKVLGEEDAHSLGRCQVGRPTKISPLGASRSCVTHPAPKIASTKTVS